MVRWSSSPSCLSHGNSVETNISPGQELEELQLLRGVLGLDEPVVLQERDQGELHGDHGVPLTHTVPGSLTKPKEGEMVRVVVVLKIARVELVRVGEAVVVLFHPLVQETEVDDLTLPDHVVR